MPKPNIANTMEPGIRLELVGLSLMRGAANNGVPRIGADCGGACARTTRHVYVGPRWLGQIGLPEPGSQGPRAGA